MQFINSPRGDTEARISFDDLYRIVREKLNYFHPDRSDPDAFCQDMCVRIEKKMGIYPNVSGPALATTAGDGWQPIETAPKDGRSIWAYLYHTGIRLVRWGSAEEWAEKEGGNPYFFEGQWVDVYDESEDWSPKWWLPADALPLPPALVTDKG